MWLDDINRRDRELTASSGRLSIGGALPAAETDSEHRDMCIVRAGGVLRIPAAGEKQLVLACDNGEYALLGRTDGEIPPGMEAGEIYIETENAAVLIMNNGKIKIRGELEISGSLTVNGRSVDGA
ncbi:MAG: hypothetical protein Q4A83_01045 [Bacillota bacterium]|nr:hypothetical protein [Bacillota bacterium]